VALVSKRSRPSTENTVELTALRPALNVLAKPSTDQLLNIGVQPGAFPFDPESYCAILDAPWVPSDGAETRLHSVTFSYELMGTRSAE
jgi:hypothetical protein